MGKVLIVVVLEALVGVVGEDDFFRTRLPAVSQKIRQNQHNSDILDSARKSLSCRERAVSGSRYDKCGGCMARHFGGQQARRK